MMVLFNCKKKTNSKEYKIYAQSGYQTSAVATFLENKKQTEITINYSNLTIGTTYSTHIHKNDTAYYGSSTIIVAFETFTAQAPTHTISKMWDTTFTNAFNTNGCIAIHNAVTAEALGGFGVNNR
jgi:hypothetical protein